MAERRGEEGEGGGGSRGWRGEEGEAAGSRSYPKPDLSPDYRPRERRGREVQLVEGRQEQTALQAELEDRIRHRREEGGARSFRRQRSQRC